MGVSNPVTSNPLERLNSITQHLNPKKVAPNLSSSKYFPENKPYDPARPVKAIIIGAGITGIATSILLNAKVPNLSYTVYEKHKDIGGTWSENIYPGVRCDVPSHCYQLSIEPNPNWSEFYASGKEIHDYYKFVAQKYDVNSHIKLQHEIVRAVWSVSKSKWIVEVQNLQTGDSFQDEAEFLVTATGRLDKWAFPDIPGLQDVYQGHLRHTSNWDPNFNYTNKRIAVIGNGASGMQIVPNLLPKLSHLDHYIRSTVWISPTFRGATVVATADQPGGPKYSEEERKRFREDTAAYLAYRKDLEKSLHGGFRGGLLGSEENAAARALWLKVMSERVGNDPEWIEKLVPTYSPGCKRPTPAPGYLEALIDPKKTFISDKIVRATATGLVTADGTEREVDAIITATGHVDGFIPRFPTIGMLTQIQRVVVVGASVSAFDITHEVVRFAQTPVYSSVRAANPIFGLVPFDHPSIDLKPTISHVSSDNGKKVVFFSDGSKVEDVDHIIYGTGYTFSVPFLPNIRIVDRIVPNLYLHIFSQDDPTLAFIGGTAGGFTFRVFEWQAVAIARVFAGRSQLPPVKEQQKWVDDRLAKIPAGGFAFIKIGDNFEGYFESLRQLAGQPEEGSPGHVLPKFDPAWVDIFGGTLQNKIGFWKKVKAIAERHAKAKEEGKPYDPDEIPVWLEEQEEPPQLRAKL